ncbi:MAG TPA: WD40 repeat domain-containing protein [Pyrinomonadaceae bacterium]|nr:WD40 repeat domain-containing protein [Pyrinomonadaceae bacterium]
MLRLIGRTKTLKNIFASLLLIAIVTCAGYAGQPVIWETSGRAELLKGDARGVSISDTGMLMLAPSLTEVFNTEQAFVWSSTLDDKGNVYLGTGHDGKIFRVSADGKGALFYDAAELDVTALAIGHDGAVYAGTSPDGKVYRITADGNAEVYFDPADKYIWSLAVLKDGSLAVGTGDNGKLYRVKTAGAKPESSLLFATNQTHVISLAVTQQGDVIAGTDPGGLVLRISPEGKAFALFDAQLREIHALAPAADGSIYALALSEAASTGRGQVVSAPAVAQPTDGSGTTGATTVTITAIDESGNPIQSQSSAARSRTDLASARSAVFRILPDGATDVVWSSPSITAFAIAPSSQAGTVLIGTADKGRVYSVTNDGRDTLLLQSTEGQISSFVTRGNQVFAASSNQGKLFRFGQELVAEGSYESPVRDAKLTASWGRIWWRGKGNVEVQTRSGNGERPDATWSEWSSVYRDPDGSPISSPRARFVQWRATLKSSGAAGQTWMEDASVAYLPRNVAPEVLSITPLPNGVGLQQIVQLQVDPNIESSGLDPSVFGAAAQVPPRRFFQRGARSFQWQAEDRNSDTLEYAIYYRPLNESTFRLLKDKVRDNFYTIDGATLADGRYIIKIVASDAPDNPPGQSLSGERLSEPVDIDNTPPVLRVLNPAAPNSSVTRVVFEVEDLTGKIRKGDFSVDGAAWTPVFPEDGIADSGHERYSVDLPALAPGEHTISLRAFDSSGNVGTLSMTLRR